MDQQTPERYVLNLWESDFWIGQDIFINLKVKHRFCPDTQHLPSPTGIRHGSYEPLTVFLLFPVFDRLDRVSVLRVAVDSSNALFSVDGQM
jgi:hypothetical protein